MTKLAGFGFVELTDPGVSPDYIVFLTGETDQEFIGNKYKVMFDPTTFGPAFKLEEMDFKFGRDDPCFLPMYRINPIHNAAIAILPNHVYALELGYA